MKNERVNAIVEDLVDVIRGVMLKHSVTNDEFKQAIEFLEGASRETFELQLMLRNFFEITTAVAANQEHEGSAANIAGPFYLEGAPEIANGEHIKVLEESNGEEVTIRGHVKGTDGKPIEGVKLDVWHSTPVGTYSGVHPGIPADHYRAKLTTDAAGYYEVKTTKPVPYQIPHDGHTGQLLTMMGRHSWRPAHVHFKAHGEGLVEHITQVYFEGEDYVDSDCCDAVIDELVLPTAQVNGENVITKDFVLDPA